jgi:hypothetical protein
MIDDPTLRQQSVALDIEAMNSLDKQASAIRDTCVKVK